jgi:hypothetical protein
MFTDTDVLEAIERWSQETEMIELRDDTPKLCTSQLWRPDGTAVEGPCGKPAVQESLLACGHVTRCCAKHITNITPWQRCSSCGWRGPAGEHTVTRVSL